MKRQLWTSIFGLALVMSPTLLAASELEAVPSLVELEHRIFGDGSTAPVDATAPILPEGPQTRWWCCFTDADCQMYGARLCVGGDVCGVCVP